MRPDAIYQPHMLTELHSYARFFPVSNPEAGDRMLTLLIPAATRLGTVTELNNLRDLVVEFESDESVVRPYQWGMMDQEWMLALQVNRTLQKTLTDRQIIANVFSNSAERLAKSQALRDCSHSKGTPIWMFQVGNKVTHMGGLFMRHEQGL